MNFIVNLKKMHMYMTNFFLIHDRKQVVALHLLDHGDGLAEGGREEGPERALDVGLARLPVALKSG
jgi:hypothetical protein